MPHHHIQGWPRKAKETPSPEVILILLDTNPEFQMSWGLPKQYLTLILANFLHMLLVEVLFNETFFFDNILGEWSNDPINFPG